MGSRADVDEEASFNFTKLEDLHGSDEKQIVSPLQSPLKEQHWPRSYDRAMNLYSRSPSFVKSQSFTQDSKQYCNQQGSDPLADELRNGATDARLPLISRVHDHETEDDKACDQCSHVHGIRSTSHNYSHSSSHGSQQGHSSFFQAVLNGINVLAGVGILSMPYAILQGGWLGLSCLFLFAAVCCYTAVLLRRCLDLHPSLSSYPDIGEAAFGKPGRIVVSSLLYSELFAVAVEFLILEGDNLAQLISFQGLQLGTIRLSSTESFVIISAGVMLVTVWLRDLSILSYLSAGGVLACLTVLLAVAWTGISGTGFSSHGRVLNLQGFPIAVGLYAFCYCGHAVIPNIYGSMREKRKFSLVLVVCFVMCTFIYGGIAIIGFLMFGDGTKTQVTFNLPTGKVATKVAVIATLINPFAKYALTVTPLAAALEELLPLGLKTWTFYAWGMTIRTLLVISTVVIALTVPFFAYLMALVGSFLSISVAIIIPCLCYMKLFSGSLPLWETLLNILFLAIGTGACIAGTYSSILEIVEGLSTSSTGNAISLQAFVR